GCAQTPARAKGQNRLSAKPPRPSHSQPSTINHHPGVRPLLRPAALAPGLLAFFTFQHETVWTTIRASAMHWVTPTEKNTTGLAEVGRVTPCAPSATRLRQSVLQKAFTVHLCA